MKAREKLKALLRFCIFEAHKDNSRLIVIGYSELTNRITQLRPLLADSGGQSYEFLVNFCASTNLIWHSMLYVIS